MGKEYRWPCKLKARMFHDFPQGSSLGLPKPSDDEHHHPFKTGYKIRKKLVVKKSGSEVLFSREVFGIVVIHADCLSEARLSSCDLNMLQGR